MKKLALALTLTGILALYLMMFYSRSIEVNSSKDLFNLEDNQKVIVKSKVISDSTIDEKKTLKLENNITAICLCNTKDDLKGSLVKIEGTLDTFIYPKIHILKLEVEYDS